jgi:hypothetical protein
MSKQNENTRYISELKDWTKDQTEWIKDSDTYMSFKAVKRLYDPLGEIIVRSGVPIFIFRNKKNLNCRAFIKQRKQITKELAFYEIMYLGFYPSVVSKIPKNIINPLQVQRVYTISEFEHDGIASYVYALLVRDGYTIISDKVQYLGDKELWKKMAREANLLDYSIYIHNDDTGYIKDQTGNILKYDASNIDDSIIWKTFVIGQKTVLILTGR